MEAVLGKGHALTVKRRRRPRRRRVAREAGPWCGVAWAREAARHGTEGNGMNGEQ